MTDMHNVHAGRDYWKDRALLAEERLMAAEERLKAATEFRFANARINLSADGRWHCRVFGSCYPISMSDLFHESLPDEAIDRVFAVMALTPEINYMILTKRAERMGKYFIDSACEDAIFEETHALPGSFDGTLHYNWPLPNVALGVSVESQKYADERIPHLLRIPAAMRFVSQEPQLEEIDYSRWLPLTGGNRFQMDGPIFDIIIVGGESGPAHRIDLEVRKEPNGNRV